MVFETAGFPRRFLTEAGKTPKARACPRILGQLLQFRTASVHQNIQLEVHLWVLVKLIHAALNDI